MSSPADVDLGSEHLQKQERLRYEEALRWATQDEQPPPESETSALQDPSQLQTPGQQDSGATPGSVAKDIGVGIISSPQEIAGGAATALTQTAQSIQDVGDWLGLPPADAGGLIQPGYKSVEEAVQKHLPPSGTVTGGVIRGVSQFLTGMLAAGPAVRGLSALGTAGKIAKPIAQGALASFAAFDPAQKRLSNLIQEIPALANPVNEFLAADPADTAVEGRMKQAIEGVGLGLASEGLLRGLKALRGAAMAKRAAGVTDEAATGALRQAETLKQSVQETIGDPAQPAIQVRPRAAPDGSVAADAPGEVFINWGPIQSREEVKAAVQVLADARAGNIKEAARGVRPWAATRASAAELDAWKVLEDRQVGEPLNAEKAVAVRELWIKSGQRVLGLARNVTANGGDLDRIAFNNAVEVHNYIQEIVIPARTETARAFNAWAIPVGGDTPAFMGQWEQLREMAKAGTKATDKMAERIVQLGDAGKLRELDGYIEATRWAKTGAALRQSWYSGLLSSPKTIARSGVGNTSMALVQLADTKVANYLGKLTGAEYIPDGEATQRFFGMIQGYKDAWVASSKSRDVFEAALDLHVAGNPEAARMLLARDAAELFQSGGTAEAQGGTRPFASRTEGAFDPEVWGLGRDSVVGRFMSFMDTATTASTRALNRTDEWAKSMAFNSEIRAQAFRQATQEAAQGKLAPRLLSELSPVERAGLAQTLDPELAQVPWTEPLDSNTKAFLEAAGFATPVDAEINQAVADARRAVAGAGSSKPAHQAIADRVAEIMASPSDSMRLAARTHAEVSTFSNAPLRTPLWQAVDRVHRVPVLGDIVLPFARTPYNIATQTMQRTPLAPFMKSWQADIQAGGARGSLAWSRFIVGNGILLTAADLAFNGRLTGSGPSDPKAKATLQRQGWKPYSVLVDGHYYDYRSVDPIGGLLGLAANTADILRAKNWGHENDDPRFQQLVMSTSLAIAAQVTAPSYMTGFSSFFNAMSDPQRYGQKWWTQLITSVVIPRGAAEVERVMDPNQRIAWDIGSALRAQIPGLSSDGALARDLWGRPITSGTGWSPWYDLLSPFGGSERKSEPADAELERLQKWISVPERVVGFGGVQVDFTDRPDQYSRYVELAGNAVKDSNGLGLLDSLNALVTGKHPKSELYQRQTDGPDGGKAMIFDDFVDHYRNLAKVQMLREFPDLRAKIESEMRKKRERLMPQQSGSSGREALTPQ